MTQPEKDIQNVLDRLNVLEPAATETPRPAGQALVQVQREIDRQRQASIGYRWRQFLLAGNRRLAFAAFLFLILFGFAFSFPAVRAAASEFLGLFRVQKFAAISISPEQIALLQRVAEEGLTPGELEIIEEPGALRPVGSLAEARAETGLPIVQTLVSLGEPAEIWVVDGGNGRLTVDLAGARAIVEATGTDPLLLPDSLDGAQVNVSIFAGVQQEWADGTMLLQTESPIVEYPENVDPTVLGAALLQVLGMNEDEAHRLSQTIDWTSTLLLPVPQNFASFNEIVVNGVSGLALNSVNGDGSALFWQKDGVVYLLVGPGVDVAELASLAGSLQ